MAYNILIVDDSLPMRAVIKKTIKASGFGSANFYEAGNGVEALQVLKDDWLDLVITDYNMPEMDGLQLMAEMKKDEVFKSIPALVVTTEGSREKVAQFLSLGAAGYIKKPFTPEEIKSRLTDILGESDDETGLDDSDDDLDF